MKRRSKVTAMVAGAALVCAGLTFGAGPAEAATCHGKNHHYVSADPVSGGQTDVYYFDSCKANQLVDEYGNVKDATALAAFFAGKWPAALGIGGVFFAWAWANQSTIKSCAKKGTGIYYTQINGIIVGCSAQ